MNFFTKAKLVARMVRYRLTWHIHDANYRPKGLKKPLFKTAREAARMIPDGALVVSSGMAGNMRASILYWAIREEFEANGHPRNLSWLAVGGQGGRGIAPGTVEELGRPGLNTRLFAGHLETYKTQLAMGERGECELHTLPQGVMTHLIEAQIEGKLGLVTDVGVGTFLDPRIGQGTAVTPNAAENFVRVHGDKLRYHLPPITGAAFLATGADTEGNLYMKNASLITEARDSALAARKNGGVVVVAVAEIVPKRESEIFLRADQVDAIVVNPRNEQTAGFKQTDPLTALTEGAQEDAVEAVAQLKFVNEFMRITPHRGPVEDATARLAADVFVRNVPRGATINIGIGLPEEVCRVVTESGLYRDVTFTAETGVMGGLPTPGIFFGAGINPTKIISSAEIFRFYKDHLDCTILGVLQADSQGNVNVSKRGEGARNYVGPGGFIDLTRSAKVVIFVGSWMAGAQMAIEGGRLKIVKKGKPKFVDRVDEITFNARQALELDKKVFYVTNVGVFQLTRRGMELVRVMPGVDIQKDILDGCPMKVVLPAKGDVPVVDAPIVTGKGFRLAWPT